MKDARDDIAKIQGGLNDLRQYSRRNSVRIYNPGWIEVPHEDTNKMVLELAWNLGVELHDWQIDRSHRVGKSHAQRQRPILVKFIGYGPRRALYEAGQNMRKDRWRPVHLRDVFINEDLTRETSGMFFKARSAKKEGTINAAITRDGRVMVRTHPGSNFIEIKTEEQLEQTYSRGSFSEVVAGPPANAGGNVNALPNAHHPRHRAPPQGHRSRSHTPRRNRRGRYAHINTINDRLAAMSRERQPSASHLRASASEFVPSQSTNTETDKTDDSSLLLHNRPRGSIAMDTGAQDGSGNTT